MQTQQNTDLTQELLRELAKAEGPCVTLAFQTSGNVHGRLEDATRELEQKLDAFDSRLPKDTLQPLRNFATEIGKEKATGSRIFLSAPAMQHVFTSEQPVQEIAEVSDSFHLRSLLPLLKHKTEFYLLALSQNHPRLLHCTESESGEVSLPPDAPKSYDDSRQTRQPDHDLENRSSAGPSLGAMKGVLSGSSGDADNKDEYLHNYYRAIDRAIHQVLRESGLPLVVVAVQHELALYRSLNTYPNLIEPGVHGAPDGMKGGEMHKRALELLESHPSHNVQKLLDGFEKQAGTGHASSHAQEIVKGAYEGRISHLFLQENAEYRGVFDEMRQKVKKHEEPEKTQDLLNEAVIQTLRHGGDVALLTASEMPNGLPVCALFRYPAPALQAVMRETASSAQ